MIIDGNNFISHHLKNNILFTAGKIGITELKILYAYQYYKHIDESSMSEGYINSGIYPATQEAFSEFAEIYLDSIKSLDIAPIWGGILRDYHYSLYTNLSPKCYNTRLEDLEPYYFDKPWTDYLKDKNVLVISPFADSIEKQFNHLSDIWQNKIMNNFKLTTIKFPFSKGLTEDITYRNFNDCLTDYKKKINNITFDICIIGAGAYALPLCAYIKTLGKSSINLGGATQILFGIKGSRWQDNNNINKFYNEYWITPAPHEIPNKFKTNEGGCYW